MSQEAKKIGNNKLSQPKEKPKVKVASAFEMNREGESDILDISRLPKRKPVPEAEDLAFDDGDDELVGRGQNIANAAETKSRYTEAMLKMAKERKEERQAIKKSQ